MLDLTEDESNMILDEWDRLGKRGMYGYCPSYSYFRDGNDHTWKNTPHCVELDRFLNGGTRLVDLGCGLGKTLELLRSRFTGEIVGVEISQATARAARRVLAGVNVKIVHCSMQKYDVSGYDRIFTYIPLCQSKLLAKCYQSVAAKLHPGTLWYEVQGALVLTNILGTRVQSRGEFFAEIV